MLPLSAPDFDVAELFAILADHEAVELSAKVVASIGAASAVELAFIQRAEAGEVEDFPQSEACGTLTQGEMQAFYKRRMVPRTGPLRSYYSRILTNAKHDKCPFCAVGVVSTVDHYLPKQTFADLTITPANLVPCCKDCNFYKGTRRPVSAIERILHPYYDDVSDSRWLRCELQDNDGAVARFFVDGQGEIDANLEQRITYHLKELKLFRTYGSNAGNQLAIEKEKFSRLDLAIRDEIIRDEVSFMLAAHSAVDLNSWQAALYEGMLESAWYLNGGWGEI